MELKYFDAHSHLNFPQFDEDRDEVIAEMREKGIATITIGTDLKTSKEAVALAEHYEHLFAAIGIHPTETASEYIDISTYLEELLRHPKVVAVGECGLDYYRIKNDELSVKDNQKELFKKQIEFAITHDLPLMIHGRPSAGTMDAYEDIITIISNYKFSISNPGNVHFFVGDTDSAKRFLALGLTLSFDGPITFTHEYDEMIRSIPDDMILAETDAPFAAPLPARGRRNSPLLVPHVVSALARIKGLSEDEMRAKTVANTLRVFPKLAEANLLA